MGILQSMKKRRSYYKLNKELPISEEEVESIVKEATRYVPDAFNMRCQRVVVVFGKKHEELWKKIYHEFGGKVSKEKIESFKAGAGTILYFYDMDTIRTMKQAFPSYADNFPVLANQSSGMLQLAVWTALREKNIGANLQHYNPVIDEMVKKFLKISEDYVLLAQMPFGGIAGDPAEKQDEDISLRVETRR